MNQSSWKDIPVVPNSTEFLDVVLNRTQRKTPTVIRPGFKISRIRAFYMRKVRYTGDGFCEKLQEIVEAFPKIDDIHPFYSNLLDTLYEKNHYKISLGSLSRAKGLVEQVTRDYVRLLKFGQSLFQCKQLKRAALGRMATIVKRLKDPLAYLENVRQHIGRLPAIDPQTRTLVICGYPNVGKSSFLRSITRADVEVQPYAFTTKSLYVGHFDYKYLRFQAIDTPGILDRPIDEMTGIEMQSINAITFINSCILYFMDLSEQCGFSVEDQVKLFHSIKPTFFKKNVFVVFNKIDVVRPEDLDPERKALIETMEKLPDIHVQFLQLSCITEEGIMEVRNKACDILLSSRLEHKTKNARMSNILNKIHVARPTSRGDSIDREPYIPPEVLNLKKYDPNDPERRKLSKDIEAENGGAGVYQPNYSDAYILDDEAWKNDIMPEILDGKNVYDFLDPEISKRLQELEEEEERLEKEGFYESEEELLDSEEEDIREKAEWIRDRQSLIKNKALSNRSLKNRAIIPRKMVRRTVQDMESAMSDIGVDTSDKTALAKSSRKKGGKSSGSDVLRAEQDGEVKDAARMRDRLQTNRLTDGVESSKRTKAERMAKLDQRDRSRVKRTYESEKHTTASLPKHLYTGKRGIGKTQRR